MMSDKEFMGFEDRLRRPDRAGWINVARRSHRCGKNRKHVFAALATPGSVDDLLKTWNHEVKAMWFGILVLTETGKDVLFDPNNDYKKENVVIEPFALKRDFHKIRPDTYEIVQSFVLYHGLYFDQEKGAYVDLDGEEIVRVLPSWTQVREDALLDYLATRGMVLVLYYHYTRERNISVAEVFGKDRLDLVPKSEDATYSLIIMNPRHGSAHSQLVGKRVVRPHPKRAHRIAKGAQYI